MCKIAVEPPVSPLWQGGACLDSVCVSTSAYYVEWRLGGWYNGRQLTRMRKIVQRAVWVGGRSNKCSVKTFSFGCHQDPFCYRSLVLDMWHLPREERNGMGYAKTEKASLLLSLTRRAPPESHCPASLSNNMEPTSGAPCFSGL